MRSSTYSLNSICHRASPLETLVVPPSSLGHTDCRTTGAQWSLKSLILYCGGKSASFPSQAQLPLPVLRSNIGISQYYSLAQCFHSQRGLCRRNLRMEVNNTAPWFHREDHECWIQCSCIQRTPIQLHSGKWCLISESWHQFCFWVIPSNAYGLPLDLHSGINTGGDQGTMWNSRDQI